MKHKDMTVATIAKEAAAEFSNIGRCLYPALRFRIKLSKFLQLSILVFIQKLDTHRGCEINRVTSRVNTFLFSFFLPFSVVTDTSDGLWDFPLNNHKKCIRPSVYHNQRHPVHRQCFPLH